MFKKKIIFLIITIFFLQSCAGSWDSVKRGVTGAKSKSSDEFLVKKKDPLILPPDFENLPAPDERDLIEKETESFEQILTEKKSTEDIDFKKDTNERSILEQIRNK